MENKNELTTWHIQDHKGLKYNYTISISEIVTWATLLKQDPYFVDEPKGIIELTNELDSFITSKKRCGFQAVKTEWIQKELSNE